MEHLCYLRVKRSLKRYTSAKISKKETAAEIIYSRGARARTSIAITNTPTTANNPAAHLCQNHIPARLMIPAMAAPINR